MLAARLGAKVRATEGGGDTEAFSCGCGVVCACAGDTVRLLLAAAARSQGCAREEAGLAVEEAVRACDPAVLCAVMGGQGIRDRACALAAESNAILINLTSTASAALEAERATAQATVQLLEAVPARVLVAWGTWCGETGVACGTELAAAALWGGGAGEQAEITWRVAAGMLARDAITDSASVGVGVNQEHSMAARVLSVLKETLAAAHDFGSEDCSIRSERRAKWAARAMLCLAATQTLGATGGAVAAGAEWTVVHNAIMRQETPVILAPTAVATAGSIVSIASLGWLSFSTLLPTMFPREPARLCLNSWAAITSPAVVVAAISGHRQEWERAADAPVALLAATQGARADVLWAVLSARDACVNESARGASAAVTAAELGLMEALRALHRWGALLDGRGGCRCERHCGEDDDGGSVSEGMMPRRTSALVAAARAGQVDTVRLLLQLGVDVDGTCVSRDEGHWRPERSLLSRNEPMPALWVAVLRDHVDVAVALVEAGASTVWDHPTGSVTILMACVASNHSDALLKAMLPLLASKLRDT